ncbi:hypothetical protein [Amycolatopsis alkalitolerans]|nr:hypothetical protein [Amycolatopsis alkalitolerans]
MLKSEEETAGQSPEVGEERAPAPPRRDADGRRERPMDPGLCGYCRRYPRRGLGGRGRTADFCDHVWAVDEKGREVTCARLDEADQVVHAAYGSAFPGFDVAGLGRDISRALAEINPLRHSLTALGGRLDEEVAAARERAETAEQAREKAVAEAAAAEARAEAAESAAADAEERAGEAESRATEAERRAAADRQQAQQAHTDRIAALGKAEALGEQVHRLGQGAERAAERLEDLTAQVSARAGEAEAAHARARSLESDLRELSERHTNEVAHLRDRHEQALADLRARDEDARVQLRTEHDRRIAALRHEHETALTAVRHEVSELTSAQARDQATANEARATAASAGRDRDSVSGRLTELREGILTALAEQPADLPPRLRTLLDATRPGGAHT